MLIEIDDQPSGEIYYFHHARRGSSMSHSMKQYEAEAQSQPFGSTYLHQVDQTDHHQEITREGIE